MYMAAEGAQAQSARLEVIANNLANVNTVGFKPEVASFQSRFAEAIQQGHVLPHAGYRDDVGGGVKVIDTVTDFSAGRLQETGNPLDLAIIGDGFFQVEVDGQQLLTRAGNFSVDSRNLLVNQAGYPVLDAGGSPIALQQGVPIEVSADGAIVQGDTRIPLALVTTDSLGDLVKVGGNLFRPLSQVAPVDAPLREVRSNFLELSGSNPTRQMMQMIETQRAFEANIRMVENHDSMSSNLIGRVLQG
jgi:flagellar basal-body rod protein FlgF/flagellar basal-body rod protein FlgG